MTFLKIFRVAFSVNFSYITYISIKKLIVAVLKSCAKTDGMKLQYSLSNAHMVAADSKEHHKHIFHSKFIINFFKSQK